MICQIRTLVPRVALFFTVQRWLTNDHPGIAAWSEGRAITNMEQRLSPQSDYRCHNFATACWAWCPRGVPTQPYILLLEGTSNFQGTSDILSKKKAYFFRLMETWVGLIILAVFVIPYSSQVQYNWTEMNVKLLSGWFLLFQSDVILIIDEQKLVRTQQIL